MNPILQQLDDENDINVAKLNVDAHPDPTHKYNVVSIPTMIVFEDGEEKMRIVGARPLNELVDLISRLDD